MFLFLAKWVGGEGSTAKQKEGEREERSNFIKNLGFDEIAIKPYATSSYLT